MVMTSLIELEIHMQRDDYPSFIDWWIENQKEYEALADAEDGRLEVL